MLESDAVSPQPSATDETQPASAASRSQEMGSGPTDETGQDLFWEGAVAPASDSGAGGRSGRRAFWGRLVAWGVAAAAVLLASMEWWSKSSYRATRDAIEQLEEEQTQALRDGEARTGLVPFEKVEAAVSGIPSRTVEEKNDKRIVRLKWWSLLADYRLALVVRDRTWTQDGVDDTPRLVLYYEGDVPEPQVVMPDESEIGEPRPPMALGAGGAPPDPNGKTQQPSAEATDRKGS